MRRLGYGWIGDFETFRDARFQASVAANDGFGLLSGRVTYTPPSGNWDLAIFGTNLTDQWYRFGGFSCIHLTRTESVSPELVSCEA